MICTIQTASGKTIHVVPDNSPVYQAGEIALMSRAGLLPNDTELISTIKEKFPGAFLTSFQTPDGETHEREATQMAFLGFNVDEAPDTQDFTVLPAGDYQAVISGSSLESNKAGTGSYLKLEFTLCGDKAAGRKLFANLNLDNPSAQAVEIARGELKKIAVACGKVSGVVNESEELHDIPLMINVGIEVRKDNGEQTNRIKSYKGMNAAPAARPATPPARPTAPAAATTAAPRPAAGGQPAWAR